MSIIEMKEKNIVCWLFVIIYKENCASLRFAIEKTVNFVFLLTSYWKLYLKIIKNITESDIL